MSVYDVTATCIFTQTEKKLATKHPVFKDKGGVTRKW